MKQKVNIGLDIGVASVGWSILDAETFKIIKHGVRLFPNMEVGKDGLENVKRRDKRSARRQIRRRRNLKLDFIKYLLHNGLISFDKEGDLIELFIDQFHPENYDILSLRHKGLTQPLTFKEMLVVLYWYLSNRGYKYETQEDIAEKSKIANETTLTNQLPVNIQMELYKKEGYYRGEHNRLFSSKLYIKEIEQIFAGQKDKKITSLKNKFYELFKRQRSFEEGPGSEAAFAKIKDKKLIQKIANSKFNRFRIEGGALVANESMWTESVGRCIYDNKPRAPKNSLSAELFNLLNDLNNISIGKEKLSIDQKIEIIKLSIKYNKNIKSVLDYLKKEYELESIDDIGGLRIDPKKNKIITQLSGMHKIKSKLKKHSLDLSFEDLFENDLTYKKANVIDEIIIAFSKTKIIEKRFVSLEKINNEFNLNWSTDVLKTLAEELPAFSETHAFSINFIRNTMLPKLLHTNFNQMEIIHKDEIKPIKTDNLVIKTKYLPTEWLDDSNFIASPTAKRGIRQTIKVLNRIIKDYSGKFDVQNIVIEMARELNGKAEKEKNRMIQAFLKDRRDSLQSLISAIEKENGQEIKGAALAKLWLYEQQKGFDAYTGEKLDVNKVVLDPSYTDIDHIIPYSQSFIDSRSNKVLTLATENSKKGNKTPWQYLSSEKFNKMTEKWREWYLPESNKGDRRGFASLAKYRNMTTDLDMSKTENAFGFIQRNLVDTRYITKEILAHLSSFIHNVSEDSIFANTKVKTINGRMTSYLRKLVEKNAGYLKRPYDIKDGSFDEKTGKKQRNWNGHHAEDATLVVHLALKNHALNKFIEKVISDPYMSDADKKQIGEKMINKNWDSNKSINFKLIRDDLNEKNEQVAFSRMITKKDSFELSNDTIYGAKYILNPKTNQKELHKVVYITLADLNADQEKATKFFSDNYKYTILMKEYDPKTWNILKSIYETGNPKAPFELKQGGVKIGNRKIKGFKVIVESKDIDMVLPIKNKNGDIVGLRDTLNWNKIAVFKNDKSKNKIIPLNVNNQKLFTEKNDKFYLNGTKFKGIFLHKGAIIQDLENRLYYLAGASQKSNELELKPLFAEWNLIFKYRRQTLNKVLVGWRIVEITELGRIIKKTWIF